MYPSDSAIDNPDDYIISETLKCFVESVTKPRHKHDKAQSTNRKCIAIEQAIIAAATPKVICFTHIAQHWLVCAS